MNVTVVPHGRLSYLTVWGSGQNRPTVSTLNSPDGRIKANAAIVSAGANEAISVYASMSPTDSTDVVLDVDGFYVPATEFFSGAFYPVPPCRIIDTRNAVGDLGGPSLIGGQTRVFPVLEATQCGIPSSANAYSYNFTAIPKGRLGYLTAWGDGLRQPKSSLLNALTGTVTANAAILGAGYNGAIDVFVTDDTDLVVDVNGYIGPVGPGAQSMYTVPPCRLLDTRNTTGLFSGVLVPPVDVVNSPCNIPSTSQAYVFNATAIPQASLGYLTLWAQGKTQPVVSTLNALDGAIANNMAVVPAGDNGEVAAYASRPTQLLLDVFSYFAPPVLSITRPSLPNTTVNQPYSALVTGFGGTAPYTWTVSSGSLPAGLSLDTATGLISGKPGMTGTANFTIQLKDAKSFTTTKALAITVQLTARFLQNAERTISVDR
jgi:hypothetical protein